MKRIVTIFALVIAMVCTAGLQAQEFPGLDKSPLDIALYPGREPGKVVRVIYSRPQLKGRSLSDLAPSGKVWRTGANENTEITFYQDVNFGGADITAGTYSLFTIPGENEWTVILNKNLNQWGAYSYEEGADVARIKVPSAAEGNSLEPFSIAFKEVDNGIHMVMGWDKTRVAVPITM
ncbi:DUF2911 domain-containing protein [Robiginitalea sp. SC105]|uniref:DUF2911 domain-containing protein n=1 Tax=Robiginitalea sp. SC105 TaxID=2762332 RepID=UPI00163AB0E1|nr:DUF2911 domain-containing protein [Robiginitalea sp. SC105]MBC2839750.1 DUF2911 domain-containing protein [Robiginitalea sp. SC105]